MVPKHILKFFAKYIEQESGIIYAEHNFFQLQNRLEDISRLLGFQNLEVLHEEAKREIRDPLRQHLIDFATNNETSFFRDAKLFHGIEALVLKPHLEASSEPLRIWSAASSTGQEAVTLAMLISEFNFRNRCTLGYSILGTDISERVLTAARSGSYTQLEVQRGLPAPLLIKYFTKTGEDRWTVKSEIRSHLRFEKLNLKNEVPASNPFDLILCRNVLIYQNVEAKVEILKQITRTLIPGGILALGSGESLIGLSDDYEPVTSEGAILYRRIK